MNILIIFHSKQKWHSRIIRDHGMTTMERVCDQLPRVVTDHAEGESVTEDPETVTNDNNPMSDASPLHITTESNEIRPMERNGTTSPSSVNNIDQKKYNSSEDISSQNDSPSNASDKIVQEDHKQVNSDHKMTDEDDSESLTDCHKFAMHSDKENPPNTSNARDDAIDNAKDSVNTSDDNDNSKHDNDAPDHHNNVQKDVTNGDIKQETDPDLTTVVKKEDGLLSNSLMLDSPSEDRKRKREHNLQDSLPEEARDIVYTFKILNTLQGDI